MTLPVPGARAVGAVLAAALCLGGAAAIWRFRSAEGSDAPAPAGILLAGAAQVAVVDGETLRLAATVVRLDGVMAPARGEECRDGGDCGAASSAALARLVRDRPVSCRLDGRDGSGLVRAQCAAGGIDLNQAQIEGGWARAEADQPHLAALEAAARQARRGIWGRGAPAF